MNLSGYILNSLWQFPAIMFAVRLLLRFGVKHDTVVRYRLLLAGLALSVVLPACPRPAIQVFSPSPLHPALTGEVSPNSAPNVVSERSAFGTVVLEVITVAFCGGIVFGGFRLLAGLAGTYRLVRTSSTPSFTPEQTGRYEDLARQLALKTLPLLRVHPEMDSPAVMGWREPSILLPTRFSAWDGDDLAAALGHELTHVARNDFAWNVACHAVLLPLLYNPLSWWLRREIEVAREMVCDEMAARLSTNRQAYAQALLSMSRAALHSRHGFALNWYGKHSLEERIVQLMTSTENRLSARWSLPLGIASLSGFAFALTLGSSFAAQAQSQAPIVDVPSAPITSPVNSVQDPLAIAKGTHAHVLKQRGAFEHHWKAADGQNVVILNKSPEPPSAEERERVEKVIDKNKSALDSLSTLENLQGKSFAAVDIKGMEASIRKAELTLNDPSFQKTIADFSRQMKDGSLQRRMQEAESALKNLNNQ